MSHRQRIYKVIVLGNSTVGKTALTNRYVNKYFLSSYKSTIGVDFSTKELMFDDHNVTMQIWDTAGMERFQSLGSSFYKGANCCILVYDITNRVSFQSIDNWRKEFLLYANILNTEYFPFVVLGNKVDLNDRQVSRMEAHQWCLKHEIPFFETSAKDGRGVETGFEAIVKQIEKLEKERQRDIDSYNSFEIVESHCPTIQRRKKCACK